MESSISVDVTGLPWLLLPESYPDPDFPNVVEAARHTLWYFLERDGEASLAKSWGVKLANRLEEESHGQYSAIFLWEVEPLLPHALVTAELYPAQGSAEETLPLLGGAPSGDPVTAGALGQGTRFRTSSQVRKGLFGKATRHTVRWVFRLDDVDLLVTLERDDEESLERILPDVEVLLPALKVTR